MQRRDVLIGSAALAAGRARAAEPTTISLWHIYARDFDMIHLGIKLFNDANNGYRIEPRLIPYVQINPELIRAIATSTPPALGGLNEPDVANYASQGQFTDITDRVAKSPRIGAANFFKGPATSDQWRGKRFAVAREMNALGLYINDDLFRAKGLDPEKPPATWSAVMAAAKQLTDPANHVYGFGFCAHQSEQSVFQFLPWLWQAGGAMDRLDQPEATAALQFWTDLVRGGFVSPDVINQQQSEVISTFLAGNTAFAVGGPWELPRFASEAKFQWRVAPLPVKDDKNIHANSLGGFHFAIPKGAKQVGRRLHGHRANARRANFPPGLEHRRHSRAADRRRGSRSELVASLHRVPRGDAIGHPARPASAMGEPVTSVADRDPGSADRDQTSGGGVGRCGREKVRARSWRRRRSDPGSCKPADKPGDYEREPACCACSCCCRWLIWWE